MESPPVAVDVFAPRRKLSEEEKIYVASQWRLMWLHFKRHKVAMIGLSIVGFMYLISFLHGFFAPYEKMTRFGTYVFVPPTRVHFSDGGNFSLRPFIYGISKELDPTGKFRVFGEDENVKYPIRFFVKGVEYKLLGLFKTNLHFFGIEANKTPIAILGTDSLGRDVFSGILYGSAIP